MTIRDMKNINPKTGKPWPMSARVFACLAFMSMAGVLLWVAWFLTPEEVLSVMYWSARGAMVLLAIGLILVAAFEF